MREKVYCLMDYATFFSAIEVFTNVKTLFQLPNQCLVNSLVRIVSLIGFVSRNKEDVRHGMLQRGWFTSVSDIFSRTFDTHFVTFLKANIYNFFVYKYMVMVARAIFRSGGIVKDEPRLEFFFSILLLMGVPSVP